MPLLGEKGIPPSGRMFQTYLFLTVDQIRKVSSPLSMATPPGVVLGGILASSCVYKNYHAGIALFAGLPRTIFFGCLGLYIGYYTTRLYHQHYLGKFKYCYEYAQSRKNEFPVVAPTKFGDPKHLSHWDPPRELIAENNVFNM